jgi:hypothetical protein
MSVQTPITQTQEQGLTVLQNQNGENTDLVVPTQSFDIAEFTQFTESAKELKNKKRGVSIVPKYFEFTTSVAQVEENAKKVKELKEREAYIAQNMPFTSTIGFFQGVIEETIIKLEKDKTGEVKTEETRKITRWINEEGLHINFGAQLARCVEHLEIGTPIEIVFTHEEPVKSIEGATVKIYEVYPLI